MSSLPPDPDSLHISNDPLQVGSRPFFQKKRLKSGRKTSAIVACSIVAVIVLICVGWALLGNDSAAKDSAMAQEDKADIASQPTAPPPPPTLKPPEKTATDDELLRNIPNTRNGPYGQGAVQLDPYNLSGITQERSAGTTEAETTGTFGTSQMTNEPLSSGAVKPAPNLARNPFAQLPEEVDLLFTTAPGEETRIILGSLACEADANWSVKIDSDAVDLSGLSFVLGEPEDANDALRWPIFVKRPETEGKKQRSELPSASINESDPVAHLVAESNDLCLTFDLETDQTRVVQLRNCILTLADGTHSHEMQLRKHISASLIPVTATKATETLEFTVDTPPQEDAVVMQLSLPSGTPTQFTVEPISKQVRLDEELLLKPAGLPIAEIGVRLSKVDSEFKLRVMPRYMMNGKKQPLIASSITTAINRMSRQLRIRRANPQLLQNINSLKQLLPFANGLSGKLNIGVRVFAQTTSGELVLFETS